MKYLSNVIIFNTLLTTLIGQENQIIRHYFLHKNVQRVLGFTCGDVSSDASVVKMLSEVGIFVTIRPSKSNFELFNLLNMDHGVLGVYVDQRCSEYQSSWLFDKTALYGTYNYSYNWFILGTNLSHSIETLNDSAFGITTDYVISIPKAEGYYDLYDVFNHCQYRGGLLNVTHLGTWRKDDGLNMNVMQVIIKRRWNFHGMKLKIPGYIYSKPENMSATDWLMQNDGRKLDVLVKFGYNVLLPIADIFNFTIDFLTLSTWERKDPIGPMIAGLKEGKFDIGAFPSTFSKSRFDMARPVGHAWPWRSCFMFRTTPTDKILLTMLMQPLEQETWYAIGLFTLFATIIFAMIMKFDKTDDEKTDYSLSFLATIGALSQQGLSVPDSSSSRIAYFYILFFGLMVFNYYSAAIVSSRLNEPISKINDSLYSLIKSGFKLSSQDLFYLEFLLSDKNWEVQYFKKYWDQIAPEDKFMSVEDGVRSIMRPGYAYHADPTSAYPYLNMYFDNEMICQLTEVHLSRPSFLQMWSSWNGRFEEIAKIGFLKVLSAGLKQRLVSHWAVARPYCREDLLVISGVTIYETAPIFIFLFVLIIFSVLLCVIENLMFWMIKMKHDNIRIKVRPVEYSKRVFKQLKTSNRH